LANRVAGLLRIPRILLLCGAALASSCRGEPAPAAEAKPSVSRDEVIWERLGAWSGAKSLQTESFTSDTGAFRIAWETRPGTVPGEGTFLLTLHSAISGRPLQVVVDHRGPGVATAYVNDDPRVFFAVVEASNLEWSFTVDEAIATRIVPTKP